MYQGGLSLSAPEYRARCSSLQGICGGLVPEGSAVPAQAPERTHGERATRVALPCRQTSTAGAPSLPHFPLLCTVTVHTPLGCKSNSNSLFLTTVWSKAFLHPLLLARQHAGFAVQ